MPDEPPPSIEPIRESPCRAFAATTAATVWADPTNCKSVTDNQREATVHGCDNGKSENHQHNEVHVLEPPPDGAGAQKLRQPRSPAQAQLGQR